jgi:hypothetical protein
MDLTVFKSLPHDIILRALAAVFGLLFVRDGIYALRGKAMWIAARGLRMREAPPIIVSGPFKTRLYGLIFVVMAAALFRLSWEGFH